MNVQTQNVNGVPIQVEEVRQIDARDKGTMYSQWHVMFNSNVTADPNNMERTNHIAQILKDSLKCVFYEHADEVFYSYVDSRREDHIFHPPIVDNVEIKMAAELGEKLKRIHVHANITVTHHTILRLDYNKAKEALKQCLRDRDLSLPNPYLTFKQIPMTGVALEKYIGKHPIMSERYSK